MKIDDGGKREHTFSVFKAPIQYFSPTWNPGSSMYGQSARGWKAIARVSGRSTPSDTSGEVSSAEVMYSRRATTVKRGNMTVVRQTRTKHANGKRLTRIFGSLGTFRRHVETLQSERTLIDTYTRGQNDVRVLSIEVKIDFVRLLSKE